MITTRSRYALRAMIDIARHAGEGPVPTTDIARRQGVSAGYLERIMRRLVSAGLVSSRRGPGGGYVLVRPAARVSLADIVAAGGERVVSTPCTDEECGGVCPLAGDCPARAVWSGLNEASARYLGRQTLGGLVEQHCRAGGGSTKNGLRPLRSATGS